MNAQARKTSAARKPNRRAPTITTQVSAAWAASEIR
jgi:ribosomal protein L32